MSVWTNEELEFLKNNIDNYTNRELARILNKTKNAVQIKASRLGLKREEKYHYDKSFFEIIDNEYKAYWLGFIYADGYVSMTKDHRGCMMGIELQEFDYGHLEQFNIDIGGNVRIEHRHRGSRYINNYYVGESDVCSIRLFSKKIFDDLISHGCCQNKSLIKGAPIGIPNELMRHFIRGYFDGNGSISYSYNKKVDKSYLKIAITTGSLAFANWLSKTLSDVDINNIVMQDHEHSYKVQISSSNKVDFLKYIYNNSKTYLQRKYNKYLNAVYGQGNVIDYKLSEGEIGEG